MYREREINVNEGPRLTWILEEYLLDCGGVEVLVPVMPLPPGEPQMSAGHLEVSLGPVPRVGANRPPLALHQHLT